MADRRADEGRYCGRSCERKATGPPVAVKLLIQIAKLNELDPEAHLRYVFKRITEHSVKRCAKLLPWNVASVANRLNQS